MFIYSHFDVFKLYIFIRKLNDANLWRERERQRERERERE